MAIVDTLKGEDMSRLIVGFLLVFSCFLAFWRGLRKMDVSIRRKSYSIAPQPHMVYSVSVLDWKLTSVSSPAGPSREKKSPPKSSSHLRHLLSIDLSTAYTERRSKREEIWAVTRPLSGIWALGEGHMMYLSFPARHNGYPAKLLHSSDLKRLSWRALQLMEVSSSQKISLSLTLTGLRNGRITVSTN